MDEGRVVKKLLEHDEKLAELVTRREFDAFRGEYLQGQDEMMTILKRLDQERIFTALRNGELFCLPTLSSNWRAQIAAGGS